MAMRMNFYEEVVGSVQQRNESKIVLSQELEKWEKVVLSLCLVKRKLLKNMIRINKYNN
jgi:hypothetical protein